MKPPTTTITNTLTPMPCPTCGEELLISTEVSISRDPVVKDGRITLRFALRKIEIVGGACEHAEIYRESLVFLPEDES